MKKRKCLIMIVVFVLVCLLAACGKSSPKEDQILQDLSMEIITYKPFLTIDTCTIEQSLTNESTYSATINVMASSEYAQFDMQADVDYVKFDQGWDITNCNWNELGHTIVKYPDEDAMASLINTNEEILAQDFNNQTCTDISENDELITCTGLINENINDYLVRKGEVVSTWSYDAENDSWILNTIEDNVERYAKNVEGIWTSSYGGKTITISNLTDTGFDVSCETYSTNTIHVEKSGYGAYKGSPGAEITFTGQEGLQTESGENVTVSISEWKTGVQIAFSILPSSGDIDVYGDAVNIE